MNIEHKLEPIEHWIVDGKAYRLATEQDVGKDVYFDDTGIVMAFSDPHCRELTRVTKSGSEFRFYSYSGWKYAYIQDDSLLTPQRTPVPALGDGWYLLRDDEVLQKGDMVTGCGVDAHGVTWVETGCVGMNVGMWRNGVEAHCCARYFGPTEDTEIEPGPTEELAKTIDWTKPVRTKDGRAVRVLCTDGPNAAHPVIGILTDSEHCTRWTINGKWWDGKGSNLDLENAPQRIQREYWVNVYPDDVIAYSTKLRADETRASSCLACVKITIDCEEGEGL